MSRHRWHRRWLAAAAVIAATLPIATAVPSPAAAQDGQWWHTAWQMPQVWEVTDGAGVTVAVLDSGVDASVPDLAGAVVPGTDLVAGGDGRVDTSSTGHGTGMASLIAARGDSSGVTGVAPGATILPINVGSEDVRTNDDALADYPPAIRYAADHGADVVSISQAAFTAGPDPCPEPVADAVRYAISQDVVIVTGAGNKPDHPPAFPESCPGVVTVGALTPDLRPWESTGRSDDVDVAAPGVGISAIIPGGQVIQADGTSNAAALVAGVVALVRAEFPELTAYQVVARILATVADVPGGEESTTGHGMVRPYEALTAQVPADAPNPVFDAIPAADDADATFVPDSLPIAEETGSTGNGLYLGGVVLALLAGVVVLAVTLVVRSARRRHRGPQRPGPAPPPP